MILRVIGVLLICAAAGFVVYCCIEFGRRQRGLFVVLAVVLAGGSGCGKSTYVEPEMHRFCTPVQRIFSDRMTGDILRVDTVDICQRVVPRATMPKA